MSLAEYIQYSADADADFPYYLFERRFKGERAALLADYSPPELFADDVLALVPGSSMRYWIAGGARTGTCLHTDPLLTSAWNACLCGTKRWVLLPPDTELGRDLAPAVATPCSWFGDAYPRLVAAAERGEVQLLECVQRPGQTILVPSGWWHGVLNLEWSVAVTHNFHAAAALPALWPRLRAQFPPFSMVLAECLGASRPLLLAALREAERAAADAAVAARAAEPAATEQSRGVRDGVQQPPPPVLVVRLPFAVLAGWQAERPPIAQLAALGAAGVRRLSLYHERLGAVARVLSEFDGRLQLTVAPAAERAGQAPDGAGRTGACASEPRAGSPPPRPGLPAELPAELLEALDSHAIALHSPPVETGGMAEPAQLRSSPREEPLPCAKLPASGARAGYMAVVASIDHGPKAEAEPARERIALRAWAAELARECMMKRRLLEQLPRPTDQMTEEAAA